MKSQRGFTLTELVVVLIITGVLAAVAIPRFIDQNQFATRGAHDYTVNAIRYAQKSAIATRRVTCIKAANSAMIIRFALTSTAKTCLPTNPLTNPVNGQAFDDAANALPDGVVFTTSVSFNFDKAGRPVAGAGAPLTSALTLNITGDPQSPITIELETGLVH